MTKSEAVTRPHVYVLYTGGTIGCAGNPLTPLTADKFAELVSAETGFTQTSPTTLSLSVNVNDEEEATIDVTLDDIKPAIDSSSMDPNDWILIAQKILQNYDGYTGLVILHGTDTMAFTSSAICYLLGKGVSKPVIFTGSQVPLSKTRNDAQRNLITSITVAATQTNFNEVGLFFDRFLLRGNRAEKVSASAFPAFYSPNHPVLGEVGIEIKLRSNNLLAAPPLRESLNVKENVEALETKLAQMQESFKTFSIITVMLYPGIQASTIKAMLEETTPPVKGVVLRAFGAGNAPANDDMIVALKEAHDDKGVVLVDITQIVSGGVDLDAYESAAGLRHAGAISGYDLTPEAALGKLQYLIGMGYSQTEIEAKMIEPFQNDLSRQIQEESDSHWKALTEKRGLGSRVRRLLNKRVASVK